MQESRHTAAHHVAVYRHAQVKALERADLHRSIRIFDSQHSIFKSFCEDEYDGSVDDLLDELYAFCMVWAEHYRYHAVKKYKTADWATLGHKTRVSNRKRAPMDNPDSAAYYKKHFGVDPQW